jgi:UDP-2,4-diacetamido-2,4,6-trideoxy-beta-L-altropyranose hydrolase
MKIAFRVDSSVEVGFGQAMRCLSLARALQSQGADCSFLCRDLPGNIIPEIEASGFVVTRLHPRQLPSERVDWMVVDHYKLDASWERSVRSKCHRIMVIDDLADRPHECELLLDQNLAENMDTRYTSRVPPGCRTLLGPGYALLRPEFLGARANLRTRDGELKRVMIFMGGSDPANETGKALQAIRELKRGDLLVDVVVGGANSHRDDLRKLCARTPGAVFHWQTDKMAQLMARADLALGSGGTATLERACVGLPALVCILFENQRNLVLGAAKQGSVINLGESGKLTPADYRGAVEALTPEKLRQMSSRALELVDGKGAERAAAALLEAGW